MNYKKIYDDLIESRKMRPKLEGVYYENHHIRPVCKGGSDDPENLIDLTGEDHYMAHLLLAHAYGGKQLWLAVVAMCMTVQGVQKVRPNRRMVAAAREKAALANTKNEVRTWVRISDGEEFERTRTQMRDEFGISLERSCSVSLGYAKSANGFYLKDLGYENLKIDTNIYGLKNVLTGVQYRGTRIQLEQQTGLSKSNLSSLVSGRSNFCYGFCLEENKVEPPKKLDSRKYSIKRLSDGEVFHLTRSEFSEKFNLPAQVINCLVDGTLRRSNGFALATTENFDKQASTYDFLNIDTGEVITKTVKQMCRDYGLNRDTVKGVTQGSSLFAENFTLASITLDDPRLNKTTLHQRYTLRHKETGELITGTSSFLEEKYGIFKTALHALYKGINKSTRGFELVKRENSPNVEKLLKLLKERTPEEVL